MKNRAWDAPKGARPYPLEGEGPPHPAYVGTPVDTAVWLMRWAQKEDRRIRDAALWDAYDPDRTIGRPPLNCL